MEGGRDREAMEGVGLGEEAGAESQEIGADGFREIQGHEVEEAGQ